MSSREERSFNGLVLKRAGSRDPMSRDDGGWRVAPAPDGRGLPERPRPPAPLRRRGCLILVVLMRAFN
jgi:hypothetical protein